jgi:RNA recognition motif-containing protein
MGRVKGNATLQYASPENVRRAVGMFDGEPFIGRRLRVRVDKVFAVSNPPPTLKPQVDGGVHISYRYHTNSPNDIPIQERPDSAHWPEHSEKVQSRRFDQSEDTLMRRH